MTAADRAARMRKRDQPEPQGDSPRSRELPAKVRQTVDLTGEADAKFAAWRLDAALALGRRRVTTQAALSAMVDVLLSDESVARRVQVRLEEME